MREERQMNPFRWAPMGRQWIGMVVRHTIWCTVPTRTKSDEDAVRIGEGHFLQAHRPRKTRLGKRRRREMKRTGVVGPPDVGRDSLDTREKERANFYRVSKKILNGRTLFCATAPVSLQLAAS